MAVTIRKRVSRGKGDSPQAVDKIICRKKRYKTRRRTNQALRPEFSGNRMRSAAPWPCECRSRRLTQPTLSHFWSRRPRCRRHFFLPSFVLSAIRPVSTTRARVWFVETFNSLLLIPFDRLSRPHDMGVPFEALLPYGIILGVRLIRQSPLEL